MLSNVCVDSKDTIVSYPVTASTAATASMDLCVEYTYPLAAYTTFVLGGILFTRCPIEDTADAAAEEEAAAALASSDIENKFRLHSDKRCEAEGEDKRFSFFPFSLESTRR